MVLSSLKSKQTIKIFPASASRQSRQSLKKSEKIVIQIPIEIRTNTNMAEPSRRLSEPWHMAQSYVQQKLFNAISEGNLHSVKFFLEKGAKINARNEFDQTPLEKATYYGSLEIVMLLLRNGAEINAKNSVGWSPLHKAQWARKF